MAAGSQARSFGITSLLVNTTSFDFLMEAALSMGGNFVDIKSGDSVWPEDVVFQGGACEIGIRSSTHSIDLISLIGVSATVFTIVCPKRSTGTLTISLASSAIAVIGSMSETFTHGGFGSEGVSVRCFLATGMPFVFTAA